MPDLNVERADGVVTATIDRPARKNALTYDLFDSLGALFEEVDRTDADRALVLRGAEGEFSTGMDLTDASSVRTSEGRREAMARINAAAFALHRLSKPSVAAVDGLAVGAGMSLALGCDLVVASTRARFSAIFVRRGLSIDFGLSWLLPRLVGAAAAKRIATLGDFIDAEEALRLGLVVDLVAPEGLDRVARGLAVRLAAGPTVALAQDLALIDASYGRGFADALDAEAAAQEVCLASADAAEAIAAFLAKREARFTGR